MPRNGSGVYSLPAVYVATTGATIEADQHNTPLEDIESALTGSLPVTGSRAMTGALTLSGDATSALHAVPLQQVESLIAETAGDAAYTPAAPYSTETIRTFLDAIQAALLRPGDIKMRAGILESGWLECDGSAVSRTTYANLFGALVTDYGFSSVTATIAVTTATFTVTIASPGVVTKSGHGFSTGQIMRLTTTGALPTGLATGTDYYVEVIDANTFYLSTSSGGTRITTTGSQSGTHTYVLPGVVTAASHGLIGSERLRFSTTGALPTGMSTSTDYFVEKINASTFYLKTAQRSGSYVFPTAAGSGTQSYLRSIWGLGDGSTTFNVPNLTGSNEFIRAASSTLPIGTQQSSQNLAHTHTGTTDSDGAHTHSIAFDQENTNSDGSANRVKDIKTGGGSSYTTPSTGAHTHAFTTASSGSSEARPISTALRFVIKT